MFFLIHLIIHTAHMSKEDFTIHLVSNVSPDIFPNNNPAEFSTLLLHEIDLNAGNDWEVGVRQIMYPTHVATTSEDDKIYVHKYLKYHRMLLPLPPRRSQEVRELGIIFDLNNIRKSISPDILKKPSEGAVQTAADAFKSKKFDEAIVDLILKTVNDSEWAKTRKLLRLEYKEESDKFILHIFPEDLLVALSEPLRKCLGFKKHIFTKGEHWAWSSFKRFNIAESNMEIYLVDLHVLHSEKHQLLMSHDKANERMLYEKTIAYKFKDRLGNEYGEKPEFSIGVYPNEGIVYLQEPKFSIGVYPNEGIIKVKPVKLIPQNYQQHENQVNFFRFDSTTTELLKLDNIYALPHDAELKIALVKKDKKSNANLAEKLKSIHVELFYTTERELSNDIDEKPLHVVNVNTRSEIKNPKDLLPALNNLTGEHKEACKFTYDRSTKRFNLYVKKDYVIKLSKSLSSILGFEPLQKDFYEHNIHRAADFPVFNRAITALYAYTNIIDTVFIGDVKAPLLLTCPFKKSNARDIVNQQEFLNPTYITLNRSTLRQIDIGIYDDNGVLVPFLHGKTKLTLHFRRKNI